DHSWEAHKGDLSLDENKVERIRSRTSDLSPSKGRASRSAGRGRRSVTLQQLLDVAQELRKW
ncbi:unnamed protein product, partial [Amoebophrya sp. A25]